MSSQGRPSRPPGTIVSERGNQIAPLPHSMMLQPASGCSYVPRDVLSLPRPVQSMASTNQQPVQSILMGNPMSPENLSPGSRLTTICHRHIAQQQQMRSGGGGAPKPEKRPKHLIRSNKSTFISRGLVFDSFAKRMKVDNPLECLALTNFDRSLALIDYSTEGSCVEPLAKVFFSRAWPLCHSLNRHTASVHQLDAIVGMSSGDLVWIDLVSQRYERINKAGNLTRAPVTAVEWVPQTESLVVAAHADGLVIVYDIYGDDNTDPIQLNAGSCSQPAPTPAGAAQQLRVQTQNLSLNGPGPLPVSPAASSVGTGAGSEDPVGGAQGIDGDWAGSSSPSVGSVLLNFCNTQPVGKKRSALRSAYRVSSVTSKITALKFISSRRFVIAGHSDYLKICDIEQERICEFWPSLFGSVLSLAVSPDGRYLCCGGEDDLISVFNLQTCELVVRLAGHKAWVKSIAFDPYSHEEYSYRLASVGEDRQLIIWDLTPTTLTQPKWRPQVEIENGLKYTSTNHNFGNTNLVVRGRVLRYESPLLFPATKTRPHFDEFGESPLSDVKFTTKLLLLATSDGRVWSWQKQDSPQAIRRSLDQARAVHH